MLLSATHVEAEDAIITVETDKASMDIPAPGACKLLNLSVSVGDKIKEGDVIGEIQSQDASAETEVEITQPAAPAIEASPVANASALIDVAVPDIGEDGEVDVIEVLASVGDVIAEEDALITLETDKATMDVPSPHAGTVKEVFINAGDKVKPGSIVIKLETSSGSTVTVAAPTTAAPVATTAHAAASATNRC